MQVMKHSLIALAVAAASSQLALADSESKQSEAKGFVEGASASVLLRNTYWNQDHKDFTDSTGTRVKNSDTKAWAQGFIGNFSSGFTQGTVGFGIDAFALLGVKLDGGAGTAGDRNMSGLLSAKGNPNSKGVQSPADDWSRVGGAVKVRLSSTVLKYGEQFIDLPVLSYDDTRVLPQSFTGTLLTVNEIEGLEINAGRFTSISGMAYSSRDRNGSNGNTYTGTIQTDILGASYSISDDLSLSLYASDVEKAFKKQYFGTQYSIPLADEQKLGFDFNFYRTRYDKKYLFSSTAVGITGDGKAKTNNIGSLAVNYEVGAHNFILAFQKSSDYGYDYDKGDGGGTIYLANSFYSDFNSAKEKSYQASYELNGSGIGVDGLTFKTAYVYGTDADWSWNGGGKNGKEREFYNRVQYTVQEGTAKGLSFKVSNSLYRANRVQHENYSENLSDWRLFVEYPLDLTF